MHLRTFPTSRIIFVIVGVMLLCAVVPAFAVPPQNSDAGETALNKPFVVEYYYKVKWGHSDEFIALFRKNHYPLLKKQVEMGRMLKVSGAAPRYHGTEDARWDYRVTIVFKNATVANDGFDEKALIKQLYPDQETYKKEEQRRFEILDAHWDLPLKDVDLNQQ